MNPWERRLAEEGLAPLGETFTSQRGLPHSHQPAMSDAVERWQKWALAVLNATTFTSTRHRHIWRLYATGKTYSQIQGAVGGSRRSVSWAIAAIESASPPKPCSNPWRQDHKGHDQSKDPRIAWYAARRRRRAALKQKEEPMPAPNPLQRYARIIFSRGADIEIKGRSVRNDRMINVNARAVAGGLEVFSETTKGVDGDETKAFPYVMLIPWTSIKQADREQDA